MILQSPSPVRVVSANTLLATTPLEQPHLLTNYIFDALRLIEIALRTLNQHLKRDERVNINILLACRGPYTG